MIPHLATITIGLPKRKISDNPNPNERTDTMPRPVTLFTGQWADIPCETMVQKAKEFGYDGVELACWGDHFEVDKADATYCQAKRDLLDSHGMKYFAISTHLVGQAVCDNVDARHAQILPDYIYGDGDPEGVRQRAFVSCGSGPTSKLGPDGNSGLGSCG